jgi:hypothetical protein
VHLPRTHGRRRHEQILLTVKDAVTNVVAFRPCASKVKSPSAASIENTDDFTWLAVRDDFRNWLIRQA